MQQVPWIVLSPRLQPDFLGLCAGSVPSLLPLWDAPMHTAALQW